VAVQVNNSRFVKEVPDQLFIQEDLALGTFKIKGRRQLGEGALGAPHPAGSATALVFPLCGL